MKKLKPSDKELLVEVLKKRIPPVLSFPDDLDLEKLTSQQVDDICQALTDEFAETGLMQNSEPNERGLRLETLIDCLR